MKCRNSQDITIIISIYFKYFRSHLFSIYGLHMNVTYHIFLISSLYQKKINCLNKVTSHLIKSNVRMTSQCITSEFTSNLENKHFRWEPLLMFGETGGLPNGPRIDTTQSTTIHISIWGKRILYLVLYVCVYICTCVRRELRKHWFIDSLIALFSPSAGWPV